jgi:hypothetical protein
MSHAPLSFCPGYAKPFAISFLICSKSSMPTDSRTRPGGGGDEILRLVQLVKQGRSFNLDDLIKSLSGKGVRPLRPR